MKKLYLYLLVLLFILTGCSKQKQSGKELSYPYTVFVSILPQKYFVDKIAKDKAEAIVMVGPGHSPATYEPLPKQMAKLSQAKAFFKIGVPFENAWMNKIKNANKDMKIIDTSQGIKLREIDTFKNVIEHDKHNHEDKHGHKDGHEDGHTHSKGAKDPHIWLNPRLVKIQAENILIGLIKIDPANEKFYRENLKAFKKDLDKLYSKIKKAFNNVKNKKIMVFHPVFGYLTDEFGFKQIPIEISGKKPSAKELAGIIEYAKENNVKVIFVQRQFSTKEAERVAEAINGKVVRVNPLSYNYYENMINISVKIKRTLEK